MIPLKIDRLIYMELRSLSTQSRWHGWFIFRQPAWPACECEVVGLLFIAWAEKFSTSGLTLLIGVSNAGS